MALETIFIPTNPFGFNNYNKAVLNPKANKTLVSFRHKILEKTDETKRDEDYKEKDSYTQLSHLHPKTHTLIPTSLSKHFDLAHCFLLLCLRVAPQVCPVYLFEPLLLLEQYRSF